MQCAFLRRCVHPTNVPAPLHRLLQDMAGDLVRGVGESLLSAAARHTSRPSTTTAAVAPVPAVAATDTCSRVRAARESGPMPAAPQACSPGRKSAAAQLSVAARSTSPAKLAVYSFHPQSTGGSSAAAHTAAAMPPGLTPAVAPSPADPHTQPLAAGLITLPSFSSCGASAIGCRGSSASSGPHRRTRSLGSGQRDDLSRAASGGSGSRCDRACGVELPPAPVPQRSTEIAFMPLAHQGRRWPADTKGPPAGAAAAAAAVAAVPLLSRSTVAALLGEPDEAGRQCGSGRTQPALPREQSRAVSFGSNCSADSTSMVALPWDAAPAPRSAASASSAQPLAGSPAGAAAQRSMRRPPRPTAASQGGRAVAPRVRLPPAPLPPPVRCFLCRMGLSRS